MGTKEEIAGRLRQARIDAGSPSVKEAAERLGVGYSTYAGHENGFRAFDHETAALYARRYKVSLDWLLTGRGQMADEGSSLIQGDAAILAMLARIDGLTDTDIDVAFAVIKNALQAKQAAPEPSGSRDQPQPANRRRESEPSR